jgi:hypothetical protein
MANAPEKTPAKKPATKTKAKPKKPYKAGPAKETRADKEGATIEKDILEFWQAIGKSDLQKWDRPWVYNMLAAENAGKFLLNEERKVYKGGYNQYLIASYTRNYESNKSMLILNRTEMATLFGVPAFGDTPVVKNGIKSIGSIFSPPVQKTIGSYWNYPSGARWSGTTKEPTPDQVQQLNLQKKDIKRPVFSTFPVWSAEDVYPFLPEEHQKKIDELVDLRKRKGYDINPEDQVEVMVDNFINDMVKRQGIHVNDMGNEAFYVPALDTITLPEKEQFINPIARLATTSHEMAHSTKHLTGRNAQSKDKTEYAIEEVVAETTAVMMVKQFERQLADILPQRPDIVIMFQDYYTNAMTYNHGWGEKFDFLAHVETLSSEKENNKGLIKTVMVNIAKAADALSNGTFTPEERLEAKNKNFARATKLDNSAEMAIG